MRPCGETMYSGDHRKGLGLLATIFVLLVPIQQLFVLLVPIQQLFPQPAVTGYYWPPGHETFTFRPFTEDCKHDDKPKVGEYVPGEQSIQSSAVMESGSSLYFPDRQLVHVDVCTSLYLPAGQPWSPLDLYEVSLGSKPA